MRNKFGIVLLAAAAIIALQAGFVGARPVGGTFCLIRLNSTDFHAPLGGIERGGWKLAYQPAPNEVLKDQVQIRRAFANHRTVDVE